MQDDRLIELTEDPLAPRGPWRSSYLKRPVDRLPTDVTRAFDRIYKLERQNDQLHKALLKSDNRFHWLKIWAWILAAVVTAEFAAIGGLTSWLLDRVMK